MKIISLNYFIFRIYINILYTMIEVIRINQTKSEEMSTAAEALKNDLGKLNICSDVKGIANLEGHEASRVLLSLRKS